VLVANRPRLMREMVLAIIMDEPDIEVVGETESESQIIELVERTRPDFLIIGMEQPDVHKGLCGFLVGRYPQLKILTVSAAQNNSVLYWAFIEIRSKVVEASEQGLLSALRNPLALVEA
jgi:chemotaxis response regulator CheB